MPEISRSQIVVYGAVGVALLLIGANALRQSSAGSARPWSTEERAPAGGFAVGTGGRDVVVDVAGEVVRPGVYRLPAGSRVNDAVERAGGAGPAALLDAVNLAARLADGQQVVIPARGPAGTAVTGAIAGDEGPISLGTATVDQLDEVEGIGPVTAGDIVEFRDQHGGLASVEQLDQISGIGPATMEALRSRLQP